MNLKSITKEYNIMGRKADKLKRKHTARYIRIYCEEILKLNDFGLIDGKMIRSCKSIDVRDKYAEIIGIDPNVDYLNKKYETDRKIENNSLVKSDIGFVYFLITEDDKYCKIGYSNNPKDRIKSIQTGCPLELRIAGYIKGNTHTEGIMHAKFKRQKTFGEWFYVDYNLLRYLILNFYI